MNTRNTSQFCFYLFIFFRVGDASNVNYHALSANSPDKMGTSLFKLIKFPYFRRREIMLLSNTIQRLIVGPKRKHAPPWYQVSGPLMMRSFTVYIKLLGIVQGGNCTSVTCANAMSHLVILASFKYTLISCELCNVVLRQNYFSVICYVSDILRFLFCIHVLKMLKNG